MPKICIKRKILKSAFIFILGAWLAATGTVPVAYAQTTGGFSVKGVIPDNQIDKRQTYFDLLMNPGDEQEIEIIITNSQNKELVADVGLNDASTGRNGLILYTESGIRDEVLKVSTTDIATLESTRITVPPKSSKSVKINIKMPNKKVNGVILGGITVAEANAAAGNSNVSGVSLKNVITYAIALKITQDTAEVKPNFDLTAITPCLINYKTAVSATLVNKAPRIIKGMVVNAQIFKKGSDEPLYSLNLDKAEMAPLSKGNFIIEWEGKPLKAGVYRLKMSAEYKGDIWEWDKDFTIAGEASTLNSKAVGLQKGYGVAYWLLAFAVLLAIAVIAYKIGSRNRRPQV